MAKRRKPVAPKRSIKKHLPASRKNKVKHKPASTPKRPSKISKPSKVVSKTRRAAPPTKHKTAPSRRTSVKSRSAARHTPAHRPYHRKPKDWLSVPPDQRPFYIKKDGTCDRRRNICKYLKKDGTIDKRFKLPKGVRSLPDLIDFFKPVKPGDETGLFCQNFTEFFMIVAEYIEQHFFEFDFVYMGGKKISYKTFQLYGDDYINKITEWYNPDGTRKSPPTATYRICRSKTHTYLFF